MAFAGVGYAHASKSHITISTKIYFICLVIFHITKSAVSEQNRCKHDIFEANIVAKVLLCLPPQLKIHPKSDQFRCTHDSLHCKNTR